MGIDLNCGNEYFGCRYSAWKYLRYNLVAEKVVEYIHKIKNINNIFTYDLQIEFRKYNELMTKQFNNMELITETSNYITFIIYENKEFLKSFEMDGVVYLLNKSDCLGEYTVKESERILVTIKNIRKHLSDDNQFKDIYDRLIKLFEESVNKNIPVTIS
jgi:hypothetical protein